MGFPFIFQDKKYQVENPKPDLTLAEYLRDTLHLTGTKIACGSSGCGSCTVILSRQAVFETSSNFTFNYLLNEWNIKCLFRYISWCPNTKCEFLICLFTFFISYILKGKSPQRPRLHLLLLDYIKKSSNLSLKQR